MWENPNIFNTQHNSFEFAMKKPKKHAWIWLKTKEKKKQQNPPKTKPTKQKKTPNPTTNPKPPSALLYLKDMLLSSKVSISIIRR